MTMTTVASAQAAPAAHAGITREPFGTTPDGTPVELFTLRNAAGVEARVATYGGTLVSLRLPDREGRMADVVLGFDDLEGYLGPHPWFGALIGRYANRIWRGRFTLDGRTYTLPRNLGGNHIHGGPHGFDRVVWDAAPFRTPRGAGVVLNHVSPAGHQGYPGRLAVQVTCTLTAGNRLAFDYHATTDRATPVNLTHHAYFNLAGEGAGDVAGHELTLNASRYLPVDSALLPTGECRAVAGTAFDFTTPWRLGARIDDDDPQLALGGGYDHCFVLDPADGDPAFAARLVEPASGRMVEVFTTEPGIQLYTGNALDGGIAGKGGRPYRRRAGVALETQHFPDSPNHPAFPATILRPGQQYASRTVYRFGVHPLG
jgi:aldose 1-epimerase